MGLNEVVHQLDNGVRVQLAAGMGIQHGGLIDVLFLPGHGGFDGQQLHLDDGHVQGGTLHWQAARPARMYPHAVNEAVHLHTGVGGQVFNEASGVKHVSSEFVGRARDNGLYNVGSVFPRTFVLQLFLGAQLVPFLFPAGNLLYAAAGVFVQRAFFVLWDFL